MSGRDRIPPGRIPGLTRPARPARAAPLTAASGLPRRPGAGQRPPPPPPSLPLPSLPPPAPTAGPRAPMPGAAGGPAGRAAAPPRAAGRRGRARTPAPPAAAAPGGAAATARPGAAGRGGQSRRHRGPQARMQTRPGVRGASGCAAGCSALGPRRGSGDPPSIARTPAQGVPAFLRSLVLRCRKAALPRTHLRRLPRSRPLVLAQRPLQPVCGSFPPTPPFLCFIARKHRESHSPYHNGISERSWFGPTTTSAHHKEFLHCLQPFLSATHSAPFPSTCACLEQPCAPSPLLLPYLAAHPSEGFPAPFSRQPFSREPNGTYPAQPCSTPANKPC